MAFANARPPAAGEAAPVGVVLAGGESRRMGRDKATLGMPGLGEVPGLGASTRLGASAGLGEPAAAAEGAGPGLAQAAAERLARVCPRVVVADRERGVAPAFPSLADGPGRGPAAGLLGAAAAYPGRPLLALACDLPRVSEGLLAALAGAARRHPGGWDWIVPRGPQGLEPLCALYGPRALAALAARVAAGRFALHPLAREPALAVWVLGLEDASPWGPPAELFTNLNRPEDLALI